MQCFDEPAYKASFALTIDGVPPGYTALSNMPQSASVPSGANSRVSFAPTPKLCTYLLALVVAPLYGVHAMAPGGYPCSAYAVDKAVNRGLLNYSLDVAIKVIPLYVQLFGQPVMVPEMKMVAVPDFAAGAMENVRQLEVDGRVAVRWLSVGCDARPLVCTL